MDGYEVEKNAGLCECMRLGRLDCVYVGICDRKFDGNKLGSDVGDLLGLCDIVPFEGVVLGSGEKVDDGSVLSLGGEGNVLGKKGVNKLGIEDSSDEGKTDN